MNIMMMDEETAKPKDEGREPEQQGRAEHVTVPLLVACSAVTLANIYINRKHIFS
jgi:hypothetical protein